MRINFHKYFSVCYQMRDGNYNTYMFKETGSLTKIGLNLIQDRMY